MLSSKLVEVVKIFKSVWANNDNKTFPFKLFHSIDFVTDLKTSS